MKDIEHKRYIFTLQYLLLLPVAKKYYLAILPRFVDVVAEINALNPGLIVLKNSRKILFSVS